jgi:predicted lipoprotein
VFRPFLLAGCLLALSALPGCKIVKTGSEQQQADGGSGAPTDPKARAEALWTPKIVPYAENKAGPFNDVMAQAASAPDAAVKTHGFSAGSDAKPVLFARIEGTVVSVDTASRAGTVAVDTTGDGKPDLLVQIGPVIRGSALRDGLDFVPFSSFANQIDYADFSKALNVHVRDIVLKDVKRDGLQGRHVRILGAFFLDPSHPQPLVTPVEMTVEGAAP